MSDDVVVKDFGVLLSESAPTIRNMYEQRIHFVNFAAYQTSWSPNKNTDLLIALKCINNTSFQQLSKKEYNYDRRISELT